MAKIRLVLVGDKIRATPVEYLGGDLFARYRTACEKGGARYNGDFRCNEVRTIAVATFLKALRDAKFDLDITPDLAAHLQAQADAAKADVIAADTRAFAVDAKLREKGLALFGFQRTGVAWLAPRQSAFLCDQMGTGKTVQSLIALDAEAPVLVISPAVAKGVWKRETGKWREDLKVTVLSGKGSFRWPAAGEMVAINYDLLPDEKAIPAGVLPGTIVVCDEAHVLKGAKTLRTQRVRALHKAVWEAKGKTWGLTATPLLNRPPELWSLLTTFGLEREVFGSWQRFVDLFGGWKNRWGGYEWGTPSPEVGVLLQRVMLRRLRSEVLKDLPGKTRTDMTVEIPASAKKAADKIVKALTAEGVDLETALAKVFSSAAGVGFEQISAARAALAAAKTESLLDLVEQYEEQEEPVVVFSAHVAPLEALAKREGWGLITGETSAVKRTQIEEAFQRGALKGVAASIKAGGVAITLTRASNAVFVDLDWTPALNLQAEDRLLRIGQTRPVQITRLLADHALDVAVLDLLAKKTTLIDGSVEMSAQSANAALDDLGSEIRRALS